MARIRSIHPGLATDEAFMAMTPYAMAAWPILWTECDDHGIFEWKPLVLKARILPAASIDFGAVLAEWLSLNTVSRFTVEGKEFGAVRNFCRFQRPKKPAYRFPLPPEFGTFVGLKAEGTEPVPHLSPTEGEKAPQMEDEGGRREEVLPENNHLAQRSTTAPRREVVFDELEAKCLEAAGLQRASHFEVISAVLVGEDDLESVVLPALRAMHSDGKQGRSWKYYLPAIEERRKAVGSAPAGLTVSTSPAAEHRVFVVVGTPEWTEWRKVNPRARPYRSEIHKADGYYFPSQWPTEQQVSAA